MGKVSFLQSALQSRQYMVIARLKANGVHGYAKRTDKMNFDQGVLVIDTYSQLQGRPLQLGDILAVGRLYSHGPYLAEVKLLKVEEIKASLTGPSRVHFNAGLCETVKLQG